MKTTLQNLPCQPVEKSPAKSFRIGEAPTADPIEMVPRLLGIQQILVPIDFSETSLKSLQYAIPFAQQFDAKLTLVHIVETPAYAESPYGAPLMVEELNTVKKELEGICATKIPPGLPVEIEVRQDAATEGILKVARECCADLIITTTHGRTGLKHLVMGSTAENIVRRAPCPVLVVREREHDFV